MGEKPPMSEASSDAQGATAASIPPQGFSVLTADGVTIRGLYWQHSSDANGGARSTVIINAATSVACRYYTRFAAFLVSHGFNAIVYDYRGIGLSRPETLIGLDASWIDWGRLDFEAVLGFAKTQFRGQPISIVAHSIGGFVVGLAPSNAKLFRIFTIGAQYAVWRDYAPGAMAGMVLRWHLVMPAITAVLGYFPGKRLGWLEDTPRGVVQDWSGSRGALERWRRLRRMAPAERGSILRQFAEVTAPILALSVMDDPFGTSSATERLLAHFSASNRVHLRIPPEASGHDTVGHFAFFHSRFETTLWQIPLDWLRMGTVAPAFSGFIQKTMPAAPRSEGHTKLTNCDVSAFMLRADGPAASRGGREHERNHLASQRD